MKKTLALTCLFVLLAVPGFAFVTDTLSSIQTTSATPLMQNTFSLEAGSMWTGTIYVKAAQSTGAAQKVFKFEVAARRLGTANVQLSYVAPLTPLGDAAFNTVTAVPVANGTSVSVSLTGLAATTINWYIGFIGDVAP